ncbi:family 16 glycoside hydrolase [Coraliomargarita akajimensis]|uniref:3-keto-alpha-glucoside-1,2-lyase/3-keto-2-hydroxy-glucal hydratase domain-containing protein n=1 Tax=Coraliomargarita akajimensis (strain DSM 45221 / IAM 15411 / JCM 23193 / KCTC 12865 / 04OKA010-24) TaxID=583355 RepID=D5ER01_CORAD|nr:family 16 glycoside hydrolase [Coraliomargarita akajimensis]ADE53994.1 protein of unknown function DUF1080 [Coraliomargarita akajimensis DSM 45221]
MVFTFIRQALCFALLGVLSTATAALPKVLVLGDEVLFTYKDELVSLLEDKAKCTFVKMPKVGQPDWDAFYAQHIYNKGYAVIHFNYGRELMRHVDGKPVAANNQIWGIYTSLIKHLGKSDAFLVGATTTPVRGKMDAYQPSVDWEYTMRFQGQLGPAAIKINDLGDYTRTRLTEMVQENSNMPTELGEQMMAEQVANAILEALNEGVDPNRPRILIVGDSIVGGYYGATRNLFAGEAVVFSGGTTYNDADPNWKQIVDKYIKKGGKRGWDVIQFNWGLHAMKHVDANNRTMDADEEGARVQFSPEAYLAELEQFVQELKRTEATLVFATTTPIPEGSKGGIAPLDQSAYNEPAKALMQQHGILVNDLYAYALPRLKDIQLWQNVHFTAYGSEQLAQQNYAVLKPLLPNSDWVELFDGTTLNGWTKQGDVNWRVEAGAIVADDGEISLLTTNAQYLNYELDLEFKAAINTNSGVFLNTEASVTDELTQCYEVNIAPQTNGFPTGSIVGFAKIEGQGERDEWRRYQLKVKDGVVTVVLDGKQLLEHRMETPRPAGFIGLQKNRGRIAFRNIRLREL